MKIKLAAQLSSQSVADVLKFCCHNLDLKKNFYAEETVKCIEFLIQLLIYTTHDQLNVLVRKRTSVRTTFKKLLS